MTRSPAREKPPRVLGIDPGTGRMGYGVAEAQRGRVSCLAAGCFTTPPGHAPGARLASLERDLLALLGEHPVSGAAVEQLYFSKNVRTAMGTAEARGVVLAALSKANIPVAELSPQMVKMGVTGNGNASKRQVQRMVQRLFRLPEPPQPDDAADALALAFAGLSYFSRSRKLASGIWRPV